MFQKFTKKTSIKRSPILAPPLRDAGQSVDEEIQAVINDKQGTYAFVIALAFVLALMEWLKWFSTIPPQPVAITIFSSAVIGFSWFRIIRLRDRVRMLRQARDGEKAVGQYLEALRERGHRVFHDVLGKDFNIDHVLIGPNGVFTVETKTISKPAKGKCEIDYDGVTVSVNGFRPDRDPISQAKAQAGWLQEFIKESTGRSVKVRPVVLYPGWFITQQPRGASVWVLNPKGFPAFLENEPAALSMEDVKLISYHLSRYVRDTCSR